MRELQVWYSNNPDASHPGVFALDNLLQDACTLILDTVDKWEADNGLRLEDVFGLCNKGCRKSHRRNKNHFLRQIKWALVDFSRCERKSVVAGKHA